MRRDARRRSANVLYGVPRLHLALFRIMCMRRDVMRHVRLCWVREGAVGLGYVGLVWGCVISV
jgi:hypothetical protein